MKRAVYNIKSMKKATNEQIAPLKNQKFYHMKRLLLVITILTVIISCNSNKEKVETDLSKLQTSREEIQKNIDSLHNALKEIEASINKLDTIKKLQKVLIFLRFFIMFQAELHVICCLKL